MTKQIFVRSMSIFVILLVTCSPASAVVIFSDNFNGEAYGTPTSALTQWDILQPSIDVVGPGSFAHLCNNNTAGRCLDMDGSPGNGQMRTKVGLDLAAGDYIFSFDYGNNSFNNNTLDWDIGSVVAGGVTSGTAQGNNYISYSYSFTLLADVTAALITFTGGGPEDNGGTILDNVSLEFTSVPAPATGLMLLMGLLGLRARARQ